jgi:hypothetical protein
MSKACTIVVGAGLSVRASDARGAGGDDVEQPSAAAQTKTNEAANERR